MQSRLIAAAIVLLACHVSAMAGESLVNGSFDDGTLSGWTILNGTSGDYHNPPVSVDVCAHDLHAADGTYFAGLTHAANVVPLPTGASVAYRQAIDVKNWAANANRTNYAFEGWAQIGHGDTWSDDNVTQQYNIWWTSDGLLPHDTAIATIAGTVTNGDTIEIDTGGVNRIYEFDTDSSLHAPTNVPVLVNTGAITAYVTISGAVEDGDTIEVDTGPVTGKRVYEFDIGGANSGIQPTSNVAVDVSTGLVNATVTISNTVGDGATIEVDTGGANRVYEFDTNASCVTAGNIVCVNVSSGNGGAGRANAKAKLILAINGDGSAPCTAADAGGNNTTLVWSAPGSDGDGATNTNLVDPTNRITVTNFVYAGVPQAYAKTQLMAAINGDASRTCDATDGGTNIITLTWAGGAEGAAATNSNLADANDHITISNFAYLGQLAAAAKAALIAAINADAATAPCSASDAGGNDVLLTWDTTSSGGATNSSVNNANGGIAITNFASGLLTPEFDHKYTFTFISQTAFAEFSPTHMYNNWRKLKLSGSIPDNPQVVILEVVVTTKAADATVDSHNVIDGLSFSAESATSSAIAPVAGDWGKGTQWPSGEPNDPPSALANPDFELGPYNLAFNGSGNGTLPTGWGTNDTSVFVHRFQVTGGGTGSNGPIYSYTNGVTTPTDPLGITTSSGSNFWGRSHAAADFGVLFGYWGALLPPRGWDPCSIGVKWRVHYLTKMWNSQGNGGSSYLEFVWDQPGQGDPNSVEPYDEVLQKQDDPKASRLVDPSTDGSLKFYRAVIVEPRSTPHSTEFSGFDEIEQAGEFAVTDNLGLESAPQHVLARFRVTGLPTGVAWKWLYDKFDMYVEAIPGQRPRMFPSDPLPNATCGSPYFAQLTGCSKGTAEWSVVAGQLPPGITLGTNGIFTGQTHTTGTFQFTVQLLDQFDNAFTTDDFEITTVGVACCNVPPADFDGDDDVDHLDFAVLQRCMTGAGGGLPSGCSCADLDLDGLGIDQNDLDVFVLCAGGPTVPPLGTCPP